MSLFEADLQALEARALRLRRAYVVACICAFGLFLLALSIVPGGFGQTSFRDVQIHLDLWGYFDGLGVTSRDQADRLILGVRTAQLQAGLGLAKVLLGVLGVSYLLRLKWRPGLAILLGLLAFNSALGVFTGRTAYRAADARQFGVGLSGPSAVDGGSRPDPSATTFTPLAPDPGLPSFHRVGAAADAPDPALPPEIAARFARNCWARGGRAWCAARAQTIRAVFASDMAQFDRRQKAAMHYTAAEVAYLDRNPAEERAQLNAIQPGDFDPTTDSDWRIRVMQHDLEKHGLRLRPGAYQPVTGVSFASLRAAAAILAVIGLVLLLLAAVGAEAARTISRRVQRLRDLLAPTLAGARAFARTAAA